MIPKLDEAKDTLMRQATSQLNLSARRYHRVFKPTCSIADLWGWMGFICIYGGNVALSFELDGRVKQIESQSPENASPKNSTNRKYNSR